jgi:hypothetical protein
MKPYSAVWGFVLAWTFFFLVLVLFVQARDYLGSNPILRARQERIEAFQGGAPSDRGISSASTSSAGILDVFRGGDKAADRPESAGGGLMPGDASLDKASAPYALLAGWLTPAAAPSIPYDAQRCHETDFQARLERTGNYRQLTNNYKRGAPDSCTAPLQDRLLPFYDATPVPAMGCLEPRSQ